MPPLLVPSSAKRIATQMLVPLDETHLDAVRGLIELRGFHPSVSTSRTRRSDAAMSDKDKQICFVIMPRTWFKGKNLDLSSLLIFSNFSSLVDFRSGLTYIIYQYISSFRGSSIISYRFLSIFRQTGVTSLEVKYDRFRNGVKELGRSP